MSWRHLLYYSPRWFGSDNSLVDSPEFFLAADGAHNSDHELAVFIEALVQDDSKKPEPERISCRFPARRAWVKKFRPDVKLPNISCPDYEDWLLVSKAKAVSLIFSSYFINNPSSMMGHTFIRLRRGKANSAPLLDKAVNFAAEATNNIPVVYNIMGLTGGFPGKFSMSPYYTKVQEYANAESRDLWEYDLNFTEHETISMLASLWEVAPQRIDYFFFDENCSEILMYLLQTARTDLQLGEKLDSFVHPSDTLRILMEEPGLVSEVVYRPSSRSRYVAQFAALDANQKSIFQSALEKRSLADPGYSALSASAQAAEVDALLAFIEFDENLYGAKKSRKYGDFYENLLTIRSRLAATPMTKFEQPADEAPHLGHRGQRIGLGLGALDDKKEAVLEWRPAQHDLLSPAIGYPPELSIELGRTRLAFEESKGLKIRSAELFHILSFNPTRSGRFPWSWQMQMIYEEADARRTGFLGSIGQSFVLDERDHYAFVFFDTRLQAEDGKALACPGANAGWRYSVGKRLVNFTQISIARCYGEDTRPWLGQWNHSWRWSFNETWEAYFEAKKLPTAHEVTAGFYRYY